MRGTDRREAALKRGANELMNLAEYVLRDNKRALSRVRRTYQDFCLALYRIITRRWGRVP